MIQHIQTSESQCYVTAIIYDDAMLPKTGLTPKITIDCVIGMTWGGSSWSKSIVTLLADAPMCEIDPTNMPGVYVYSITSGLPTSRTMLVTRVKADDTTITNYANQYSVIMVGIDQDEALKNLDVSVSSRTTVGDSVYASGGVIDQVTGSVGSVIADVGTANAEIVDKIYGFLTGNPRKYRFTYGIPSVPVVGASIRLTYDRAGTKQVQVPQITDSTGITHWELDPGVYYVWRTKEGETYPNPDIWQVKEVSPPSDKRS